MRCSNDHEMQPADAFCETCGAAAPGTAENRPVVPSVTRPTLTTECPNGHPNVPGHAHCGACGEAIVGKGVHDAVTNGAPQAGLPLTWRRRMLAWSALAAVVALGVIAVTTITGSDHHTSSSSIEAPASEPTTTVSYSQFGCKIKPFVEGPIHGTQMDPYCTEAHVIREVCGFSLDDILVPPEDRSPAPAVIMKNYTNSATGQVAYFILRLPSRQASGSVTLRCLTGNRDWTWDQWTALSAPV